MQMRCRLYQGLKDTELQGMIQGWDRDVARSADEIAPLGKRVLELWANHIGGVVIDVADGDKDGGTVRRLWCTT